MLIKVTRIIYPNYDPDDPVMSEIRKTTVRRKWAIDPMDVIGFGESLHNKDYLEVWLSSGDLLFVDENYDAFYDVLSECIEEQTMLSMVLEPEEQQEVEEKKSGLLEWFQNIFKKK